MIARLSTWRKQQAGNMQCAASVICCTSWHSGGSVVARHHWQQAVISFAHPLLSLGAQAFVVVLLRVLHCLT
jgi:hypothetical protein